MAVELEQVEDLVRVRRSQLRLLHRGEARPALLVERAHLAVDDAVGRLDGPRERLRDLWEASGQVVGVPADEASLAAVDVADRAVAVPLDLVQPVVASRHLVRESREHRLVLPPLAWLCAAFIALLDQ